MGQKQSKDRSKEPSHSTAGARSLYPNLTNEFPTYGPPNTADLRVPSSEACFGNTIPFHSVQSYYYNPVPVPSAPPAPAEILSADISAITQRSVRQENGMQTREPETWQNQEGRGTNLDKKPCPNTGDGCKLHFTPDQMKQHVKECLFMDVTCPLDGVFGRCAWRDKIKHIKTHFCDVHPSHIGAVNQEMTLDSPRIINLIDLKPHKFLVQIKVDEHDNKILFAVQHYSTQICASRWTYEFDFHGPMMANTKLEGTCFTSGTSIVKKFDKLQCRVLSMSPCVMNAFKNGALKYKYRIVRKQQYGMPKKNYEAITATSTSMAAPTERKGSDVVPKYPRKSLKKRSRKSTKTPLECMLSKH